MIRFFPTKNGTGVSIFGDYGDLLALYETVHQISDCLDENNDSQKGQYQLLMNLAYEIRKGFSGQRLKEKLSSEYEKEVEYHGFQIVWTDILIYSNVLQYNSRFISSDKFHLGILFIFESLLEKAILDYDPEYGIKLMSLIPFGINIKDKHVFLLYQALHVSFVSDKSGKERFRKIPDLLHDYFYTGSNVYKNLISTIKKTAKIEGCNILDVDFLEFPEINW